MDELAKKTLTHLGVMPYLSDHACQSANFSFYTANDQLIMTVKGGTWNLQNKGFAKKLDVAQSYSNNPWNIEESLSDYINRKKMQIDKIVNQLIIGKDFLFLQEIDFLVSSTSSASHKKIDAVPISVRQELRKLLEEKLQKLNWKVLISSQKKSKPSNKRGENQLLALLYNAKTLFYTIKCRGLFEHAQTGYRGFEWIFFHRFSGQHLALTNLHLLYDADYHVLMAHYQQEQIRKNLFTVMGGDTNHSAQTLPGAMSRHLLATNLEQREDYASLSHLDRRDNTVKDYDLFFAVPAQYTYFKSVEGESECFKLVSVEES